MLRYLTHKEINANAWDNCISSSTQCIIYAYSWYLNTVCKEWAAVVEEKQGQYISVFPLPMGNRWGQKWVLQPFYTQQLGLFTTVASQYSNVSDYLALAESRHQNILLQLNTENSKNASPINGYDWGAKVTYHLNLDQSYASILKGYKNRHKLHKAQRTGLQIMPLQDVCVITSIFKDTKGRELKELKGKHYKLLANLYEVLAKKGAAEMWQAQNSQGSALAAALFLKQKDKIIFLFSASSEEGRKAAAMTLLLDNIIQKYAEQAIILDFEGSMVPSVAKFYANFGATPVSYVTLSKHYKPWYQKWKEAIFTS